MRLKNIVKEDVRNLSLTKISLALLDGLYIPFSTFPTVLEFDPYVSELGHLKKTGLYCVAAIAESNKINYLLKIIMPYLEQ